MKSNFNLDLIGSIYLMMCMILISSCSVDDQIIESKDLNSKSVKTPDKSFSDETVKTYNENDCVDYCMIPESGEYHIKKGHKRAKIGPNTSEMNYVAFNTKDSFIVEVTYGIINGTIKANATITIDIQDNRKVVKDIIPGTTVSHSILLKEDFKSCQKVQYYIQQTSIGVPVEYRGSYKLISMCY